MNKLNDFETRLLTELRQVVAERNASMVERRSPRRRLVLATVAAGTLAAGATVGLLGPLAGSAAYAVSRDGDLVTVEVIRPEDPEGLEREIEALGVQAEVDFAPKGQSCKGPRYEQDQNPPENHGGPDPAPSKITFKLSEAKDKTLVIENQEGGLIAVDAKTGETEEVGGTVVIGWSAGPVAPCDLVRTGVVSDSTSPTTSPSSPTPSDSTPSVR